MTSASEAADLAAQPEAVADVIQVRRTEAKVSATVREEKQGTCSAAADLFFYCLMCALFNRCGDCFAR